jgi:small-conductance mechanosensitive channel
MGTSYRFITPDMKYDGIRRLIHAALGIWFCCWMALLAEAATTNSLNNPTDVAAQLHLRLIEAQTELSTLPADSHTSTNLPLGATVSEVTEFQLNAESLVRAYQEHIDQLSRSEELRQRQEELEQQANNWRGFREPAPYSILLVDELRDSVQSCSASITASETTLEVLGKFSEGTSAVLKRSDEGLRRLTEQLESEKDISRIDRLTWLRRLERIRNRLVLATVALNETRRLKVEAELSGERRHLGFLQRQLAIASQSVRFSEADQEKACSSLSLELRQINQEISDAERESEIRQRERSVAREVLRRARATAAESASGPAPGASLGKLQALADLREAQAETSLQTLASLRQLADNLFRQRGLWRVRFATFSTQDLEAIREGYQRLENLERLVRIVRPHFLQQLDLAANLIAEQRNRADNRTGDLVDATEVKDLMATFQQREQLAQRGLRALDQAERLVARWRESLDQQRDHLPTATRVRDLFSELSSFARKFWQFELFAAEDTITVDGQAITGRRSVTVGKIAMALLILAVGYWFSSFVSRFLERLAIRRLKVEANQANLIRRWVRVALVLLLVVFSLVSVKIPLTVFAFLGGALAIGLGFGTQNLLKNFISGIIILFERPFRVGDVLKMDGHRGTVISIGIRSSVIKLGDGTETLIPNSVLLENNLTNCTYSDRNVRFTISIGVAYGSDTRLVSQILAEVTERHGLVQKNPAPIVIFQEFGDNALTFELRYWVDVQKHSSAQIGSDLRHMIAGALAESHIPIPFPQRDLHLDTIRPLQIQLVPTETATTDELH